MVPVIASTLKEINLCHWDAPSHLPHGRTNAPPASCLPVNALKLLEYFSQICIGVLVPAPGPEELLALFAQHLASAGQWSSCPCITAETKHSFQSC